MNIADIPDAIREVEDGNLTFAGFYALCLDLLRFHSVEDVLAQLPGAMADEFLVGLRRDFDNDTTAEGFVWFDSGEGDQPEKEKILQVIREWLQRRA